MPQIKNADGFLHQRFCVPFTRCQPLPALQRFTRSLLLYPASGPYPSAGLYSRFSALHATKLLYTPEGLYTSAGLYSRFSTLHATQPPPSPSLLGRAGVGLPTSYPSTFSFLCRKAPFPHGLAQLCASSPYRAYGCDSFF